MLKKNNNSGTSAFIAGESLSSNFLWIIPMIDGISKSRNVKNLIFENKFENFLLKNPSTKSILNKYSTVYLAPFKKDILSKLSIFLIFFKYIKTIVYLIFFFEKKKILKKDWYNLQIFHAYWDSCLIMMKDNQIKPDFFQRFKSSMLICETIHKFLNIKNDLNYVFLGHTVYKYRVILALCRKYNIKIFTSANFNIQIQKKNEDLSWSYINKKQLKNFQTKKSKKLVQNYWNRRLAGKSHYSDAAIASKIKSKIKNYPENVVLLHIFKDSPYNVIDKERIFFDYFDWIKKTIKLIKSSNEKWAFRLHPNYKRWGENQNLILKKITGNNIDNKKILIDDRIISNNSMFRNAKRIITFSGTSHLEASCFGIKPIVISDVTLSKLDKKFVLKPKNLAQYKKFILSSSYDKLFKQSKKVIEISKTAIFIRENLLTMKKNINTEHVYRNDNIKKQDKFLFKKILRRINYVNKFMFEKGKILGNYK